MFLTKQKGGYTFKTNYPLHSFIQSAFIASLTGDMKLLVIYMYDPLPVCISLILSVTSYYRLAKSCGLMNLCDLVMSTSCF